LKLHLGGVPLDPDFDPASPEWDRLREPSASVMLAFALPLSVLLAIAFGSAWLVMLHPPIPDSLSLELSLGPLLLAVAGLALLMLAHEGLHSLALLGAGAGSTVIGFWPSHFVFYVHRFGEVSRARSVLVGLAPLLVLSVVPFAVAPFVPGIGPWLAIISVVNAAGASADLIGLTLVLLGTPRGAVLRNQGYATWWRPA
jgi:hypothetical protein